MALKYNKSGKKFLKVAPLFCLDNFLYRLLLANEKINPEEEIKGQILQPGITIHQKMCFLKI